MDKSIFRVLFFISITFFTYLLLKDDINNRYWSDLFSFNFDFVLKDKLVHIFIFMVLSFLMNLSFENVRTNVIILFVYGLLIEIIQGLFTIHRTFDIFDFMADGIGIWLGYLLVNLKIVRKILKLKN